MDTLTLNSRHHDAELLSYHERIAILDAEAHRLFKRAEAAEAECHRLRGEIERYREVANADCELVLVLGQAVSLLLERCWKAEGRST